jgi:hypothetical protein
MSDTRGIFNNHVGLGHEYFEKIEDLLKDKCEAFFSQHKLDLENLKQQINDIKTNRKEKTSKRDDDKYLEMKKELDSLRVINKSLEKKLKDQLADLEKHNQDQPQVQNENTFSISKTHVDSFVEKLLTDENVNIKYLPDYVERQLYRNIFTILLGVVQNLFGSMTINLIGHRIGFAMSPQPKINQENIS